MFESPHFLETFIRFTDKTNVAWSCGVIISCWGSGSKQWSEKTDATNGLKSEKVYILFFQPDKFLISFLSVVCGFEPASWVIQNRYVILENNEKPSSYEKR